MNILFISDNFPPEVGAGAARSYERSLYWLDHGHHVTILTSVPNAPKGKVYDGYKNKWYQVKNIEGLRVVRVKTYIAANRGKYRRILDFLSFMFSASLFGLWQKKPDVVVGTSPQFFTAVAAWFVAFIKRKPFIFEVADLWPDSVQAVGIMKKRILLRLAEKLELFLYRRATFIVTQSDHAKEHIAKRGINPDKVHVIVNGVDLRRFKPQAKDVALQKEWKLENKFVVSYIGTHGMAHALDNILSTAKLLQDRKDIHFLLVGDGAFREKLLLQAQKMQLTNLTFIPPQTKENIAKYWALSDAALVHLKDNDVFRTVIPSKIFEAMAMRLPIILSLPGGAASKLIKQTQTGLCVDPENPSALATAVTQLADDNELRGTFSKNAEKTASNYSREIQAKRFLSLFEMACK
jgi:colanic acid biosynthesis glycosyl transferase WcaI